MKKLLIVTSLTLVIVLSYLNTVNAQISTGLVGYWTFDEGSGNTAGDSAGSNTGTLFNGPVWINSPNSKIGNGAVQFDGTNDYVNAYDNGTTDFGTTNFSISFWLRYTSGNSVISKLDASFTGPGYSINWLNANTIRINIIDGSANSAAPQFTIINPSSWHHYVFSINRSVAAGVTLYIDGVPIACAGNCGYNLTTIGDISSTNKLGFGTRNPDNNGTYLNGVLDDVRLYDRTLSASEVTQIYNYTGISVPVLIPTNQPPIVGAGNNQTITLPGTAILTGIVSDDGLPVGSSITTVWSKVSGPGTINFSNTSSLNSVATFSQSGIYIIKLSASDTLLTSTSDITITVNPEIVVVVPPPTPVVASTTILKNILENSSFELGDSHGWGFSTALETAPLFSQLDNTYSNHGNTSIRLPMNTVENAQILTSKIYHLKPNTNYTLSFVARSDYSYSDFSASFVNSYATGYGPGDIGTSPLFLAPSQWKRFSYTYTTTNDTTKSTYYITISPHSQGVLGKHIWIDAIQLEEGSVATTYTPNSDVEIGIVDDTNHPGNVFFEDEPVIMNMKIFNNQSVQKVTDINYEVYDYFNRVVKSGTLHITASPNALTTQTLDLSLSQNKRGAFRLITWIDKIDKTMDETIYSVIPHPRIWGINELSMFGTHTPFQDYWLSVMQKVGMKWDRTLSTGRQFRWNENEPTQGNFVWHDAEIDKATSYGMTVLGTIGSELYHVPDWAKKDVNGLPNLTYWDNFVYQMVNHYKGKVKYWEVWNEPDTEGGRHSLTHVQVLTAQDYGQILKTAYLAAKRADPSSVIVGMAAYYSTFVDTVFNLIGDNYLDILSTHRYPDNSGNLVSTLKQYFSVIKAHGNKDVWNSETGLKTDSYHRMILAEDLWIDYALPRQREYRARVDILVKNFAESIGNGMKKYFYYDARNSEGPNFLVSYSLFEYDGTLSPMAVSLSILANLFDGSVGQGSITLNPNVTSYAFLRDATPLFIVWSNDTNNIFSLQTRLSPNQIRVYDVMGNLLPISSGVQINMSPIYIEGQGISLSQLQAGISISSVADVQPPVVSFVTFPTGSSSGVGVLLRWFGFDNVSYSDGGQLDSQRIQYSYRIIGLNSSWSSWSTISSAMINLSDGLYILEVKARDTAGNELVPISRSFGIGAFVSPTQTPQPVAYIPSGGTIVTPPTPIIGDFNNDRLVNSLDFSLLVSAWNQNNATYDINHDGIVNSLDYVVMVQNWTQ